MRAAFWRRWRDEGTAGRVLLWLSIIADTLVSGIAHRKRALRALPCHRGSAPARRPSLHRRSTVALFSMQAPLQQAPLIEPARHMLRVRATRPHDELL